MKNDQTPSTPNGESYLADNSELSNALTNQLDIEAASIDSITLAKLSSARHRALDTDSSSDFSANTFWAAGSAALTLSLLLAVFWMGSNSEDQALLHSIAETNLLTDLPILAAEDSVEFYQSLDFLYWLNNEPETNG